jgi:1-acylglycerone phosphate reductase
MLSETLRLELAPLGVTVLTGVIGGVQTEFVSNEVGLGVLESSHYKSIESYVFKQTSQEGGFTFESLETFVDHLIGDIVRGATGPVYRGYRAQTARLLAYHVPTSILVSRFSRGGEGYPLGQSCVCS